MLFGNNNREKQEMKKYRDDRGCSVEGRKFETVAGAESLESYYENIISDEQIEAALSLYEEEDDQDYKKKS